MKIGHGYDVHRLVEDRKLILGGVTIEHNKGLLGHSDADVLVHAIMDALIGAMGMGDIGCMFPDDDEKFKDADSLNLLDVVCMHLEKSKFNIGNIDATIIAQQPKIKKYIQEMQANIARVCKIDENKINIKATTEEGLGFTGNQEGIAAHAVCIIESI